MNKNTNDEKSDLRIEILEELVVKEEDEIKKLKGWVSKSKSLFKIEESGRIIISTDYSFTNSEKILLTLIGKYFAIELKLISSKFMTAGELSKELGIASTTLSGPIGNLVSADLLERVENSVRIKYYQIDMIINDMYSKYVGRKEVEGPTVNIRKMRVPKKNKSRAKTESTKPTRYIRTKIEKSTPRILNEEGIKKLAKDSRISIEELKTVFDLDDDDFRLVREVNGSTREIHLKSTLLYLTGYKYFYGIDEVPSNELRKQLIIFGIQRDVALSTNLKKFGNYVIHKKGPKGSTKTSYRLSILGLKEGTNLIHDIIKGTKEFFLGVRGEKAVSSVPEKIDIEESLESFAKILKTEVDRLREIFDFQDNYVRFYEPPVEGKIRKKIQINALVPLSVIMHEVYKIKIIDACDLLEKSHVPSDRLDLLYTYKEFNKFFTGQKRNLKITWLGIKEGKKRIKELLNNEE